MGLGCEVLWWEDECLGGLNGGRGLWEGGFGGGWVGRERVDGFRLIGLCVDGEMREWSGWVVEF